MSMTKKDYIDVASVLAGDFAVAGPGEKRVVRNIALSLADKFTQANGRFDRAKFYTAVGLTSDGYVYVD